METVKLEIVKQEACKEDLAKAKVAFISKYLNKDGVCSVLKGDNGVYYTSKRVKDMGLASSTRLSKSGLDAFNIRRFCIGDLETNVNTPKF